MSHLRKMYGRRAAAECLSLFKTSAQGVYLARKVRQRDLRFGGWIRGGDRLQLGEPGRAGIQRYHESARPSKELIGERTQAAAGPNLSFGRPERRLEL